MVFQPLDDQRTDGDESMIPEASAKKEPEETTILPPPSRDLDELWRALQEIAIAHDTLAEQVKSLQERLASHQHSAGDGSALFPYRP